jgi:hypothetical protein
VYNQNTLTLPFSPLHTHLPSSYLCTTRTLAPPTRIPLACTLTLPSLHSVHLTLTHPAHTCVQGEHTITLPPLPAQDHQSSSPQLLPIPFCTPSITLYPLYISNSPPLSMTLVYKGNTPLCLLKNINHTHHNSSQFPSVLLQSLSTLSRSSTS